MLLSTGIDTCATSDTPPSQVVRFRSQYSQDELPPNITDNAECPSLPLPKATRRSIGQTARGLPQKVSSQALRADSIPDWTDSSVSADVDLALVG